MICSNHQSNLDPILLGVVCKRFNNFLAKQSLFNFKPLAWFLRKNDTIAIDRESGIAGMKQTLKRLKRAEPVVLFPEGTRTSDGEILPLKPGFVTLAKRTKASIIPVGIAGAFAAWPKGRKFPWPVTIEMVVGKPITFEMFKDMNDDELVELLTVRIHDCFEDAKRRRAKRIESSIFSFTQG